jgi:CRP-like cAMP-binding protein
MDTTTGAPPAFEVSPEFEAAGIALGLSAAAVKRIATFARLEELPAGSMILREGRPATDLGVVVDGRVALQARVPGRTDLTLMTLDRGDIFGWSAVLREPSTSSVMTLGPTRVVLLDRDHLLAAMAADPELATTLYHQLLETISRRLVATRLQLLDLYGAGSPS